MLIHHVRPFFHYLVLAVITYIQNILKQEHSSWVRVLFHIIAKANTLTYFFLLVRPFFKK